jgi:hypothetical protein
MKRLLLIPLALLLGAQTSVQTIPGDGGPIRFDSLGRSTIGTGNVSSAGPTPVLSACGGGSPTITGSNLSGTVTTGTTATGCVITFTTTFASAPSCVVSPASGVLASFSYVVTASAITVTQTSTSGNTITYVCVGKI